MPLRIILFVVFVSSCTFITPALAEKAATGNDASFTVEDISWKAEQDSWIYKLKGSRTPTFTRYELFSPHRLRLDIAEGALPEDLDLPLEPEEGPVSEIREKTVENAEVEISRLEFLLREDIEYEVQGRGDNIVIKLSLLGQKGQEGEDSAPAESDGQLISDISISEQPEGESIHIDAGAPIHSVEASEVSGSKTEPAQLIVNIDSVGTEELVRQGPEDSLISRIEAEPYQGGSRLRIDSASSRLFGYKILTSEDGLTIKVQSRESGTDELLAAITEGDGKKKRGSGRKPKEISPQAQVSKKKVDRRQDPAYGEDSFTQSGYSGKKVSVDFYQTGLHNVFRIIGEVSGRNIIVAEGVSGTLTLSLKEVPWDFMLDIIINLKDLNKQEQFNTIIISPADKKFEWPGKDDKEDLVVSRPSILSREAETTRGKMEEAQLLRRAQKAEQAGNMQQALSYYEKLFKLDPERGDVAARITRLALTKLDLNAKAAHYGRKAYRLKPEEKELALLTATAYGRIGKPKEAVEYYEIATSGSRPSEQALKGYAAFSERYNSHRMALKLWERYEEIYGASLVTMVSRARISDLLGEKEKATEIYRRLKLSGYEIPSDLAEYIDNRIGDNRGGN